MKLGLVGLIGAYGLLAALPFCGQVIRTNAGDAIRTGADVAKKGASFAIDASKCDRFMKEQVGYDEEQALGGAVAVNFAANNRGLYLDYVNASVDQMKSPSNVQFKDAASTKASKYVTVVGKTLALQSSRPNIKWKFGILNNEDSLNAVSAPGGYVLITRKLVKSVKNEDQLAGALAHEIGHVVARHAIVRYQATKKSQCQVAAAAKSDAASAVMDSLGSEIGRKVDPNGYPRQLERLVSDGSAAFDLNQNLDVLTAFSEKTGEAIASAGYDKDQEYEADRIAADLLLSAGYSVDEYLKLLSTMKAGGAFAPHPDPEDRVSALKKYLAEKKASDPFAGPGGAKKPVMPPEFATLQE